MQTLTEKDVLRLRSLMKNVGTDRFFASFKRLLQGKLRFHTFLMMRFDPDAPPVLLDAWILQGALPDGVLDQYMEGAYGLDPFYQFSAIPETGGLYQLAEVAPDRFFSSEYFLHYFRKTGLRDEVGLLVPLASGSVAHISFSRLERTGRFKRKELRCLKHFAPLLLELLGAHCSAVQKPRVNVPAAPPKGPMQDQIRTQVHKTLNVRLTRREAEIAGLVLQGHSNSSAALTLGISRETVKVHRRNLYQKLEISSPSELFSMLKSFL
ncbi:helix-turn-helix transcriptional regulator [Sulfitobacter sp. F26169L]|uniref:helix-turn-helix domain-containing protein n=1 Tax=Sulfitobacter sp. F26169L TaxID=2996015 RepID=UPI00226086B2|nr:helix-turn-helix transcriptional regulator [Sulfitobacter sp. F26169L]MCX7568002.1 helix-turn-helix transcriptional regulator [Sulfitobacter sp. F26169L]